jgi:hypothetical protein
MSERQKGTQENYSFIMSLCPEEYNIRYVRSNEKKKIADVLSRRKILANLVIASQTVEKVKTKAKTIC